MVPLEKADEEQCVKHHVAQPPPPAHPHQHEEGQQPQHVLRRVHLVEQQERAQHRGGHLHPRVVALAPGPPPAVRQGDHPGHRDQRRAEVVHRAGAQVRKAPVPDRVGGDIGPAHALELVGGPPAGRVHQDEGQVDHQVTAGADQHHPPGAPPVTSHQSGGHQWQNEQRRVELQRGTRPQPGRGHGEPPARPAPHRHGERRGHQQVPVQEAVEHQGRRGRPDHRPEPGQPDQQPGGDQPERRQQQC